MVIDNGIANSTGSERKSLPVLLLLKLEFKSYGMTCKEQMPAERHRELLSNKYSERLVYCPSRNRTCGFPAYGSSNSRLTTVTYIGRQMRLGDIVIPHS